MTDTIIITKPAASVIALGGSGVVVGAKGDDGMSAYEIAVENGFVGDEDAWLLSLKGETGQDSIVPGPEGKSAYEIAVENGFVGDEDAWLLSLKGEKGDTGDAGSGGYGDSFDPSSKMYLWAYCRSLPASNVPQIQYSGFGDIGNYGTKTFKHTIGWSANAIDRASGIYLNKTAGVAAAAGVTHATIPYTKPEGFKISHVFGIESTGGNSSHTQFIGLHNEAYLPDNPSWMTNITLYQPIIGIGYNSTHSNWQLIIPTDAGHSKYFYDTGVAKSVDKSFYRFEMTMAKGSSLINFKLYNEATGALLFSQDITVSDSAPDGPNKVAYMTDYSSYYFYSLITSGNVSAALSYVFCKTYSEV